MHALPPQSRTWGRLLRKWRRLKGRQYPGARRNPLDENETDFLLRQRSKAYDIAHAWKHGPGSSRELSSFYTGKAEGINDVYRDFGAHPHRVRVSHYYKANPRRRRNPFEIEEYRSGRFSGVPSRAYGLFETRGEAKVWAERWMADAIAAQRHGGPPTRFRVAAVRGSRKGGLRAWAHSAKTRRLRRHRLRNPFIPAFVQGAGMAMGMHAVNGIVSTRKNPRLTKRHRRKLRSWAHALPHYAGARRSKSPHVLRALDRVTSARHRVTGRRLFDEYIDPKGRPMRLPHKVFLAAHRLVRVRRNPFVLKTKFGYYQHKPEGKFSKYRWTSDLNMAARFGSREAVSELVQRKWHSIAPTMDIEAVETENPRRRAVARRNCGPGLSCCGSCAGVTPNPSKRLYSVDGAPPTTLRAFLDANRDSPFSKPEKRAMRRLRRGQARTFDMGAGGRFTLARTNSADRHGAPATTPRSGQKIVRVRSLTPAQAQSYPGFAANVTGFKKFHANEPVQVNEVLIDDGLPGVTRRSAFLVGESPSIEYMVPKGMQSNKAGKPGEPILWRHKMGELGGKKPFVIHDALSGVSSFLGGTYRVSDWYRH